MRKMHVVQAQLATARPFLQGLEGPAAAACLRAIMDGLPHVHGPPLDVRVTPLQEPVLMA